MNSFGRLFRISIYGESHGESIGVVIDGCPAGISISEDDFIADLSRRKSGSKGTTSRIESDSPSLLSGFYNGKTTGSPIHILFKNENYNSSEYQNFRDTPRPGHADFAANIKFGGYNNINGGGHFSGRLTLAIVAAGVIAKLLIKPIEINANILEIGSLSNIDLALEFANEMNDSIGGIVQCRATNIPIGLGEPFFDSVESLISHLVFAIPAIKGIEFGNGFEAARLLGSQNNDIFISNDGKTSTNYSGGVNGGISNGNELVFKVAVKPTSSIPKPQKTINISSNQTENLVINGRHDSCIALRMPVIIECATAIVLADLMLLEQKLARK